ncbi:MAG: GntR family transcriptional regulator, partial [Polyangia bacterium]
MAERAAASSVNNVFERLLAGIVTGRYPAARHLPAERELARTVGASRPTLREARSARSTFHPLGRAQPNLVQPIVRAVARG